MKSIIILILAIISITYFSSCKDEEITQPPSEFTIAGKVYQLAHGFLEDEGTEEWEGNTYHIWELTLTSDRINWDETDGFTGRGEVIYMYLYAANDDSKLPSGKYRTELIPGNNILEIEETYVLIDHDIDNLIPGEGYADFKSMSVDVTKSGNSHGITFYMVTGDDKRIDGSFFGDLVQTD